MAVGRVSLPVEGGIAPDGTGTGNNPATPERFVSTGTQTTNTPKVSGVRLLFDQTTDEHWLWTETLPSDYGSGGTLKLKWGAKVTTGNVVWKGGAEIIDDSSTDVDVTVFNAGDLGTATAVPGTVGQVKGVDVTLTMSGATAGELVYFFVGRDADNGSDTAAGDAVLEKVTFEYTTI